MLPFVTNLFGKGVGNISGMIRNAETNDIIRSATVRIFGTTISLSLQYKL